MKRILLVPFLLQYFIIFSQNQTVTYLKKDAAATIKKPEDTLKNPWRKHGITNINLSQGSLSNWAAGGDDFFLINKLNS